MPCLRPRRPSARSQPQQPPWPQRPLLPTARCRMSLRGAGSLHFAPPGLRRAMDTPSRSQRRTIMLSTSASWLGHVEVLVRGNASSGCPAPGSPTSPLARSFQNRWGQRRRRAACGQKGFFGQEGTVTPSYGRACPPGHGATVTPSRIGDAVVRSPWKRAHTGRDRPHGA